MKTIALDVDGVLADFNAAYIDLVIEVTGKDLFPPRPFDIVTWSYPESYGYSNKEVSAVWKVISESKDFWLNLKPLEGAEDFLKGLDSIPYDDDIYFITSRIRSQVKFQTENWLWNHGFPESTVLISSEKGLCCKALKVTHYIDDKIENCEDVRDVSPSTKGYMLARPWNKEVEGVPRLNSLNEFMEVIKS